MTHFELKTTHGRPIIGNFHPASGKNSKALVIFCHGYKGFKDWGAWPLMADSFTAAGFDFIRFNFSHNGGTAEQPIDFPDLEAFSENNYSLEMQDLQTVLDHFIPLGNTSEVKAPQAVYLIGHSRGGGIVQLTTAQDSRIAKLATLASVSDYRVRFLEGTPHFEAWKKTGITYVENSRTGQMLPHKFQFYTDFIANESRLTIKTAARQIEVPHLILHGTEDPTVTLKEAHAIKSWNPKAALVMLEGADHVFGMRHPWNQTKLPPHMQQAVGKMIAFFNQN